MELEAVAVVTGFLALWGLVDFIFERREAYKNLKQIEQDRIRRRIE